MAGVQQVPGLEQWSHSCLLKVALAGSKHHKASRHSDRRKLDATTIVYSLAEQTRRE